MSSVQSLLPQTCDTDFSTDPSTGALMVDEDMIVGLHDLESDFSCMMLDTKKDLADCNIGELNFFLNNLLGVDEFCECKNIDEVLCKLRRDHTIDTFDIKRLKQLINRFHQTEGIVQKTKEYEEKKEKFLRAKTVKEFQQAVVNRAETITTARVTIRIPKKYGIPPTMKDVETLAKQAFIGHHKHSIMINVTPGNWSLFSKEEVVLKGLEHKGENI